MEWSGGFVYSFLSGLVISLAFRPVPNFKLGKWTYLLSRFSWLAFAVFDYCLLWRARLETDSFPSSSFIFAHDFRRMFAFARHFSLILTSSRWLVWRGGRLIPFHYDLPLNYSFVDVLSGTGRLERNLPNFPSTLLEFSAIDRWFHCTHRLYFGLLRLNTDSWLSGPAWLAKPIGWWVLAVSNGEHLMFGLTSTFDGPGSWAGGEGFGGKER